MLMSYNVLGNLIHAKFVEEILETLPFQHELKPFMQQKTPRLASEDSICDFECAP